MSETLRKDPPTADPAGLSTFLSKTLPSSATVTREGNVVTVATRTNRDAWSAAHIAVGNTAYYGAATVQVGGRSWTPNASSTGSRTGSVTAGGKTFTVTQAGATWTCTYTLSPASASFGAATGSGYPATATKLWMVNRENRAYSGGTAKSLGPVVVDKGMVISTGSGVAQANSQYDGSLIWAKYFLWHAPQEPADAPSDALSVTGVSHSFGDRKALDNVSLTVPHGSFVVLLGLNGAGKSTLFSLVTLSLIHI